MVAIVGAVFICVECTVHNTSGIYQTHISALSVFVNLYPAVIVSV